MISTLQLEDSIFNFKTTRSLIDLIIPKTLMVKTSCGNYGYDLVDSIGFLRENGYLTLALDFKIDTNACPSTHLDTKNIFPKDLEDGSRLNIENSMVLTAFVTVNINMPNKGGKTDDGILAYTPEPRLDITSDDEDKIKDFNVVNTSYIRLNRLGHYHNTYFCSAFRNLEIFYKYLEGTKSYRDSGMCMDMVPIDPSWEDASYDFISQFFKDGIVYNRGIYIYRDEKDKRPPTSMAYINSPMVDANVHLLNSLCPTRIEPAVIFPYFSKSQRGFGETSEIFRIL